MTSNRRLENTDIPTEEEKEPDKEPQTTRDTFFNTLFTMMTDPKEVKIKTPTKFKGEKDKVTKFIREVELYLHINKHIYDTDEKKIVFMLSFMTDIATAAWKEAYIVDKTMLTGGFAFGSWGDFFKSLQGRVCTD